MSGTEPQPPAFAEIWGPYVAPHGYVQIPSDLLAVKVNVLTQIDKIVLAYLISSCREPTVPVEIRVESLLAVCGTTVSRANRSRMVARLRRLHRARWIQIVNLADGRIGYVVAPCRQRLEEIVAAQGGPEPRESERANRAFVAKWGTAINHRFSQYPRLILRHGSGLGMTPRLHIAAMALVAHIVAAGQLCWGVRLTAKALAAACGCSGSDARKLLQELRSLHLIAWNTEIDGIAVSIEGLLDVARRIARQVGRQDAVPQETREPTADAASQPSIQEVTGVFPQHVEREEPPDVAETPPPKGTSQDEGPIRGPVARDEDPVRESIPTSRGHTGGDHCRDQMPPGMTAPPARSTGCRHRVDGLAGPTPPRQSDLVLPAGVDAHWCSECGVELLQLHPQDGALCGPCDYKRRERGRIEALRAHVARNRGDGRMICALADAERAFASYLVSYPDPPAAKSPEPEYEPGQDWCADEE